MTGSASQLLFLHSSPWPTSCNRGPTAAFALQITSNVAAPLRHKLPVTANTSICHRRKPPGYWKNRANLDAEVLAFIETRLNGHSQSMPTASQLRAHSRLDIIQAIQQHGGFSEVAACLSLSCVRRSSKSLSLPSHTEALDSLRGSIQELSRTALVPPGKMPTASLLRQTGHTRLVTDIVSIGGFHYVADALSLSPARPRSSITGVATDVTAAGPQPMVETALGRRPHHYWNSWHSLETELRQFATDFCNGFMPLQRQFIEAGRGDLLNATRLHGGLASVARRASLLPSPSALTKRPRGYWDDVNVVHAELLTFTARNGYPGLMPRRDQLTRAGRSDLAYAIMRHGGFPIVAADLRFVWHGPCSFWRVFRNLQKRLAVFIYNHGKSGVMPSVQTLCKKGRIDLVYGIALHGGVMNVAKRMHLTVRYRERDPAYWKNASNVQRELESVLRTQPLETRNYMPKNVTLVQLGRADLATAIRDHGGWAYFAQRLSLRFAFDVRARGFWHREENVFAEVTNYVEDRYGFWEQPGKPLSEWEEAYATSQELRYIPSLEMLKRDGRSDIAFAIMTYHGGIAEFAKKNDFVVAEDTVEFKPAEELMVWPKYISALERWISVHGSQGTMPTKQDLIHSGRHDLRFATYAHGGFYRVSQRLQLVCAEALVEDWLPKWMALQSFNLGLVLNLRRKVRLSTREMLLLRKLEGVLDGNGIGKIRTLMSKGNAKIVDTPSSSYRTRHRRARDESVAYGKKWSALDIENLKQRYRHLSSDDLIAL